MLGTTIISETGAHSIESDCCVHETGTGTWEVDQEEIPTLLSETYSSIASSGIINNKLEAIRL